MCSLRRICSAVLSVLLTFSLTFQPVLLYAQPASILNLPIPGAKVTTSPVFTPILLKGLTIDPDQPLIFDFIVDSGETSASVGEIGSESQRMVKYFLAALTVPSGDLWVNLSPYEQGRIIPDELGKTELGRDMLAQDYLLKQLTASLIDPQKDLGKKFWDRVYQKVQEKYGTRDVPVDTFNKVWILPETATVFEKDSSAYVVESKLKVMLDEDYTALKAQKNKKMASADAEQVNNLSAQIVRDIVLPEIEKEVNAGQNFAQLRQIYHSLILAKWYKETLKNSLMSQVYFNQNKIAGVDVEDKEIKNKIYDQYIAAYKKGVFNFIREDYDRLSGETIPRKYFSGGLERFGQFKLGRTHDRAMLPAAPTGRNFRLEVQANPVDRAMLSYNTMKLADEIKLIEQLKVSGLAVKTAQLNDTRNKAIEHTGATRIPDVLFVGEENDPETFGAIYSPDDGVVYFQRALWKRIQALGDPVEMSTRIFIRLLTRGSERDKRKAEYEYAKKIDLDSVRNLLPVERSGGKNFDDILASVRKNIIDSKISPEELRRALGLKHSVAVVNGQSINFLTNSRELIETGELALYTIALNALNREIDLTRQFKLDHQDTTTQTSPDIRVGMLAFAANPLTDAHYLVATLKAMAESRADVYFVAPTKGDYRKPALEATYPTRLRMAMEFFQEATGGLVRVMPSLPEEEGRENGINGEEKILPLLRMNKVVINITFYYGAGADHYHSFARAKDGKVVTEKVLFSKIITEGPERNKKDFEYYVRMKGYPALLRALLEAEPDNIPQEHRDFVRKFSEIENAEERLALIQPGAFFPVLDTIGKLDLIQNEIERDPDFTGARIEIKMLNSSRGAQEADPLRDEMEFPTLFNPGVSFDVAATMIRKGIAELIRNETFDINLLGIMPWELMVEVFKPENRKYLYSLVRLEGLKFDKAYEFSNDIAVLFPADAEEEGRRQNALIQELQNAIQVIVGGTVTARELRDRKRDVSVVSVARDGHTFFHYEYTIKNGISDTADAENTFLRKGMDYRGESQHQDAVVAAAESYIAKYNSAISMTQRFPAQEVSGKPDAAMMADNILPQAGDRVGGIDFEQIELSSNGPEVSIKFNPEALQELLQTGVEGFVPVIINIVPIPSILPILGLEPQREEELQVSSAI